MAPEISIPVPTADKPLFRRRWIALSLRLFLILIAVLTATGVVSVWLPFHREQQMIQTIERWGGAVETQTGGPPWLRHLVGDDRMTACRVFDRTTKVGLPATGITDVEIARLSGLANLEYLNLNATAVTDLGLGHLSRLTNLKDLFLEHTAITDAGLAHLHGFRNLERLVLIETAISDAGLAQVKGLEKLDFLSLDDTSVTDAGLVHLRGMKSLRYLYLNGTAVTATGIEDLKVALPQCYCQKDR
jgi:hypothetical protein